METIPAQLLASADSGETARVQNDGRFCKTVGITLRVSPFSRTSHVVTWLTPDSGKVVTVVKGAVRPKSAFLGQYDLFYSCEIVYYSRDRNGAHIMKECSPLNVRNKLRSNWNAVVCASYACDLALRMVPAGAHSGGVFELLDGSLSHLESGGACRAFILWYELHFARVAGFSPRLDRCAGCSGDPAAGDGGTVFSCPDGGVVCPVCSAGKTASRIHLGSESLEIMRRWQASESPEEIRRGAAGDRFLLERGAALAGFLEYHVHGVTAGRSIAMNLLG